MKIYVVIALLWCGTLAWADADDVKDVAAKADVSVSCGQKILKAALNKCNQDSRAQEGRERMHECFYQADISGASQDHGSEGVTELGFSVGDADEWDYLVHLTGDASACSFTLELAN